MRRVSNLKSNEYVFSIVSKIINIILGFAYSILFARYVGSELKGTLAYISSIVATGSIIVTIGIHQAYPFYRKQADDIEQYEKKFVSTSAFLYVIYLCVCVMIAIVTKLNSFIVSSLFLIILYSYNRVSGYVVLIEKPNVRNKNLMLLSFFEVLIAFLMFMFWDRSYIGGIFCMACLEIMKLLYFLYELRRFYSINCVDIKHMKEIILYGILPMFALVLTTLNYRVDVIMLKSFSNITLKDIGVYSVGIALAEKVLLLPDAIQEILLSKLAKNKGASEVARVCRLTIPVCICVALLVIIVGKPFLDICYGSDYNGAYYVTMISVCGTVLMVYFKMISQYNIVNHRQIENLVLLCLAVVLNVILNYLLVPIWGNYGAAFSTGFSNAICAILFLISFSIKNSIPISQILLPNNEDFEIIKKYRKR